MPPNPRPIPRFIADSTQEGIPHGRFAARLATEFREACEAIEDLPEGVEVPGGGRVVPRARLGGRVWVRPARAETRGPRARWSCSATSPTRGRRAASRPTSAPSADFTDVLAEDNPDWRIDLNDDVIGQLARRERPRRRRHPGLGPPPRPRRRRRHGRARPGDGRPGSRSPTSASPCSPSTPSRATATTSSCRSSSGAAAPRSWRPRASTRNARAPADGSPHGPEAVRANRSEPTAR